MGDKIVFNSISNGSIGDEKNFVGAQDEAYLLDESKDYYEGNKITVEDGKLYRIRLYVHNNSPYGEDSVAENVRVAFSIPWNTGKELAVYGFIFSDNATPDKYWDGVMLKSNQNFHLEYIEGSAVFGNNSFASTVQQIGDEIISSPDGVLIGYDGFDGRIPGCFQYDCNVSLLVRVVFDSDYLVESRVRLAGEEEWSENVNASIGEQVEFQICYKNTSTNNRKQKDVLIADILSENLQYIPNTITLYNVTDENKANILAKSDDLFFQGINIGSYAKNASCYIRFKAEIIDQDLKPGFNTVTNWVYGSVGEKVIRSYASVTVDKKNES